MFSDNRHSIENLYRNVAREDKVASVSFIPDSDSYNKYGSYITVKLEYTQREREALEKSIQDITINTNGNVRAIVLVEDLPSNIKKEIREVGFPNTDILSVDYFKQPAENIFIDDSIRKIHKIVIDVPFGSPAEEYPWMYGFKKRRLSEGIGLPPDEMKHYNALKYLLEPDQFTKEEELEMYHEGRLKEGIEFEILSIKYQCKIISEEEKSRLNVLYKKWRTERFRVLIDELNQAGVKLKSFVENDLNVYKEIMFQTWKFQTRHLNITGRIPIYIDIRSYLHIFLRHVSEFAISHNYEHKEKFQWEMEDVIMVMGKVITALDDKIQDFLCKNPGKRYSRYGDKSYYFEGDYYSFHIEPSGRISTFFKNIKHI